MTHPSSSQTKTFLLIDDNEAFSAAFERACHDRRWPVLCSADPQRIHEWLITHTPDVVLLDYEFPQRIACINLLQKSNLTARTLLLTGTEDEKRKQFVQDYQLVGLWLKPLDIRYLDELVGAVGPPIKSNDLALNALDRLPQAVQIFHQSGELLWVGNQRAQANPLPKEQRLMLRWLMADIQDKRSKDSQVNSARRIDWDGDQNCFLASRLYLFDEKQYWLARDWFPVGYVPHESLEFEGVDNRNDWLEKVALLLAQRYAISRMQVFKVSPLCESGTHGGNVTRMLVIPLFQSGGGFRSSYEQWRNTGFLAEDNRQTHKALQASYDPEPEAISDTSSEERTGCNNIAYGPEPGTKRVLFPVHDNQQRPVALIALDRRIDHLPALRAAVEMEAQRMEQAQKRATSATTPDSLASAEGELDAAQESLKIARHDLKVVETAERMAGDTEFDNEQWHLMKGLMREIGNRLNEWLLVGKGKRVLQWYEAISKVQRNVFAGELRSVEMTYDGLNAICKGLAMEWENPRISGRVMGTSQSGLVANSRCPPINSLHLIVAANAGQWQAVAGWGGAFDHCRHGNKSLSEPHTLALGPEAWKAIAIQDYASWHPASTAHCEGCTTQACKSIGAWLAVPMDIGKQGGEALKAAMIVHSPHPYYFTQFRAELMEATAKRLLPLLAATQREVRARNTLMWAIMHELKNEAGAARDVFISLQKCPQDEGSQLALEHYLVGLQDLGEDAMVQLRIGQKSSEDRTRSSTTVVIQDLLNYTLRGWPELYEDIHATLEIDPALAPRRLTLPDGSALRRSLRALFHNAFRYGRQWVKIEARVCSEQTAMGRLRFTVSNLAVRESLNTLRQTIPSAETHSSPVMRGHMGLAVSRQLARDAGGDLSDFEFDPNQVDAKGLLPVRIHLDWPFIDNNKTQEETTV